MIPSIRCFRFCISAIRSDWALRFHWSPGHHRAPPAAAPSPRKKRGGLGFLVPDSVSRVVPGSSQPPWSRPAYPLPACRPWTRVRAGPVQQGTEILPVHYLIQAFQWIALRESCPAVGKIKPAGLGHGNWQGRWGTPIVSKHPLKRELFKVPWPPCPTIKKTHTWQTRS